MVNDATKIYYEREKNKSQDRKWESFEIFWSPKQQKTNKKKFVLKLDQWHPKIMRLTWSEWMFKQRKYRGNVKKWWKDKIQKCIVWSLQTTLRLFKQHNHTCITLNWMHLKQANATHKQRARARPLSIRSSVFRWSCLRLRFLRFSLTFLTLRTVAARSKRIVDSFECSHDGAEEPVVFVGFFVAETCFFSAHAKYSHCVENVC